MKIMKSFVQLLLWSFILSYLAIEINCDPNAGPLPDPNPNPDPNADPLPNPNPNPEPGHLFWKIQKLIETVQKNKEKNYRKEIYDPVYYDFQEPCCICY
ncbi:UNVERIFIED_CONTAM: hypothetical protein RMT77_009519 [Armadillidium vulgare]